MTNQRRESETGVSNNFEMSPPPSIPTHLIGRQASCASWNMCIRIHTHAKKYVYRQRCSWNSSYPNAYMEGPDNTHHASMVYNILVRECPFALSLAVRWKQSGFSFSVAGVLHIGGARWGAETCRAGRSVDGWTWADKASSGSGTTPPCSCCRKAAQTSSRR